MSSIPGFGAVPGTGSGPRGGSGFQISPEAQTAIVGGIFSLLGSFLERLLHPQPRVSQPAVDRPLVDDLPDDKIIPPGKPVPSAPPAAETPEHLAKRLGYTALKINYQKAQYSHKLFPEMYTEDNPMGLYRPARQDTYNRWSKIWMNATPFKGDHGVETSEGEVDGILWGIVWEWEYNGVVTIQAASPTVTRDTRNGSNRPVDVVTGESVGLGMSAWDFAHSFLSQTNVGDNEGKYRVRARLPKLGLVSDYIEFSVS